MDTKSKRNPTKTKVKDEQESINPKELPIIKVVEFSNVEELAKILKYSAYYSDLHRVVQKIKE